MLNFPPPSGQITAIPEPPKPEEPETRWSKGCPAWVMVIIQAGKAKALTHCGRYFDWCDEDVRILEGDSETWDQSPGVYIVEGGFVSSVDWESGIDEGGWEVSDVRPLTDEEWQDYRENDEPWPPEFFAPEPVDNTVAAPVPAISQTVEHPYWQEHGCW